MIPGSSCWIALLAASMLEAGAGAPPLSPRVEAEEQVYSYQDAHNGAGPLWCGGSTCLIQSGSRVFASGLETLENLKPLNNCRWTLFERTAQGWKLVQADPAGRTREPSPLATFQDGRFFLSANPTEAAVGTYSGPAWPEILEFKVARPESPFRVSRPQWEGQPAFSEHSYRSFAADAAEKELVLFQNIGYARAEWAFRDRTGKWSSAGKLRWPIPAEYHPPQPLRLCYPDVALRGRAVHFCGVGDIVEPVAEWRLFKKQLTGREWDYVFRRLDYSWSRDITSGKFEPWLELSNLEKTAGNILPGDLWLGSDGDPHIVWTEQRLDERLRAKFFPGEKQRSSIEYAILREGKVRLRKTLLSSEDGWVVYGRARFQATPDGRLFVVWFNAIRDSKGMAAYSNQVMQLVPTTTAPAPVGLKHPLSDFFTATARAGSPPSAIVQLLGQAVDQPGVIRYARIRLF